MPAKTEKMGIEIQELRIGRLRANVVGTSPLIMHRGDAKLWRELLFPARKKNAAEKASTLKHDPVAEYRSAIYRNRSEREPAAIHAPTGAFGKAIASAAVDIPGASKSQMMRLTKVVSPQINLFGVPRIYTTMVRLSDMNRTPDISSRAIFPRWACTFEIEYVSTLTKEGAIVNLLAAAGKIVGVGDWRPQKGGTHGCFRVADDDDKELLDIVKTEGRKPQLEAIQSPVAFDADTEELLAWFHEELERREFSLEEQRGKRGKRMLEAAE